MVKQTRRPILVFRVQMEGSMLLLPDPPSFASCTSIETPTDKNIPHLQKMLNRKGEGRGCLG